jgi:hypothetical protein
MTSAERLRVQGVIATLRRALVTATGRQRGDQGARRFPRDACLLAPLPVPPFATASAIALRTKLEPSRPTTAQPMLSVKRYTTRAVATPEAVIHKDHRIL